MFVPSIFHCLRFDAGRSLHQKLATLTGNPLSNTKRAEVEVAGTAVVQHGEDKPTPWRGVPLWMLPLGAVYFSLGHLYRAMFTCLT